MQSDLPKWLELQDEFTPDHNWEPWSYSLALDSETQLIFRSDETLLSWGQSYWPCKTCITSEDVIDLMQALGIGQP